MAAQPEVDSRIRPQRPFGVAVLALLTTFNVAWSLAGLAGFAPAQMGNALALVGDVPWVLPFLLALGAAGVIGALGLWLLRPWGWVLTMLVVGCALAFQLLMYWGGSFSPIRLLVWTIAAFYLNQREVRAIFQRRPATPIQGS